MSYSYGPTVVYPSFSMGEPFGSGYDAKENCAALQGMHAVPVKVCYKGPGAPESRQNGFLYSRLVVQSAGGLCCVR